ncbi:hypothetical protein AAFF_G00121870 [Aldrovandia affinis]|uniref:Uncharacterized protein n=1 Tax=Aldrovandia affinis TaxID=143900 RepID=A0AAD7W9X8_9TELE|nr:hypothetical protein AAFF_G00121870 [Aldrovandia affinis]
MPKGLPVVPLTMQMHQMITFSPGQLIYCDVSCLCSTKQNLECQCHHTQKFDFEIQPLRALTSEESELEISWESEDIIEQWCVLKYYNDICPGTILKVNDTHVK